MFLLIIKIFLSMCKFIKLELNRMPFELFLYLNCKRTSNNIVM